MPGFANPFWLLALGLIPLIRWLHRWQTPLSSWRVSAIFLWENSTTGQQAGEEKKQPEPEWRRRAFAVALMIVAVSGPYHKSESRLLTVWIDDSLSLATVENGSTRLETMFDMLAKNLEDEAFEWEEVTLRSLTNPGRAQRYSARDLDAIKASDWLEGQTPGQLSPAIPFLSNESSHWLLTDGATTGVQTWARTASLQKVIQTGAETENSAVTRLAVRRGLGEGDYFDVLVAIHNAGLAPDQRQVELRSGQQLLQASDLTLQPGETYYWQTQAVLAGESMSALLIPDDSLRKDDALSLELDKIQAVPTLVDSNCGAALLRALSTHPGLDVVTLAPAASLLVICQQGFDAGDTRPIAQIRVVTATTGQVAAAPIWFPYRGVAQQLNLAKEWVSAAPWPNQDSSAESKVILRAGEQPLVVLRDRGNGMPMIVDTVLDMGHPLFTAQAEYAAFVATLVDLASGRRLLDETIFSGRDLSQASIKPAPIKATLAPSTQAQLATAKPLSWLFIFAASLLLILDAALLIRTRKGETHA